MWEIAISPRMQSYFDDVTSYISETWSLKLTAGIHEPIFRGTIRNSGKLILSECTYRRVVHISYTRICFESSDTASSENTRIGPDFFFTREFYACARNRI